jgi:hypothetical protein
MLLFSGYFLIVIKNLFCTAIGYDVGPYSFWSQARKKLVHFREFRGCASPDKEFLWPGKSFSMSP